jgi:hypothetical protein
MTQGFLLFAHNNEEIDYALLAAWCARRIGKYLNKPVSLVADTATVARLGPHKKYFDKIIFSDIPLHQKRRYRDRFLNFNNYDRSHAWDLTPYEETMVIDTDIVIQSNIMNSVWGSNYDLLVCANSIDAYTNQVEEEFRFLNETSIKFYWATQFYFKKNTESEIFFKTCKWVRANYVWLSRVYDIDYRLLRNDYVWSIAIHMLNQTNPLPWTLLHTTYRTNLHSMQDQEVIIYQPNYIAKKIKKHDIHVMHKDDLIKLANQEMEQAND